MRFGDSSVRFETETGTDAYELIAPAIYMI